MYMFVEGADLCVSKVDVRRWLLGLGSKADFWRREVLWGVARFVH